MTKQATLAALIAALSLAACNSGNSAIPSSQASPNTATPTPATTNAPPMVLVSATPAVAPTAVTNLASPTPATSASPSAIQALDANALVPVPSSTSNTLAYSYKCTSQGSSYTGTEAISNASIINGNQTFNLDSSLPISSTQAFKERLIIGLDSNSNTVAYGTYDFSHDPTLLVSFVQPTIIFDPTAATGASFTTTSSTGTTSSVNFLGTTSVITPLGTYANADHYQSLSGSFQQDLYFSLGVGIVKNDVTDGLHATSCLLVQAPTSF